MGRGLVVVFGLWWNVAGRVVLVSCGCGGGGRRGGVVIGGGLWLCCRWWFMVARVYYQSLKIIKR